MHFFDFVLLHEEDQLEILWYNGEQIGRRKEKEFLILLYQVEGFYVEVYYNTKYKEIEKYLGFECTDKLEPYISHIDLAPVYKCLKKKPKNAVTDFGSDVIERVTEKKQPAHQLPQHKSLWRILRSMFHKEG